MASSLSRYFANKAATTTGCACNQTGYTFLASWLQCYPARLSASKAEFKQVLNKVKSGDVSTNEVIRGTVYTAVFFGIPFFIGEFIGKGSLAGYQVGDKPGSGEHH